MEQYTELHYTQNALLLMGLAAHRNVLDIAFKDSLSDEFYVEQIYKIEQLTNLVDKLWIRDYSYE